MDAVVARRDGSPVSGLTASDFTVLEDGREQKVVSFDVVKQDRRRRLRERSRSRALARGHERRTRGPARPHLRHRLRQHPHVAAGRAQRQGGRRRLPRKGHPDQGRRPPRLHRRQLLVERARGTGRADLLAVLKDLEGRRFLAPAGDRLTDYEAVQITVYRDVQVAAQVAEPLRPLRGHGPGPDAARTQQNTTEPGMIDMYVDQRALDAYLQLRNRLNVTFGLLERSFQALQDNRDRKTVILVSEGFVYDPSNRRLRTVTEAARRANAALYFVDTRGLEALSMQYSAEFGPPMADADRLGAIADIGREGDGAEALAADTGGFSVGTRTTSPPASSASPASRGYYLLRLRAGRARGGRQVPQDRSARARPGPRGARAQGLLRRGRARRRARPAAATATDGAPRERSDPPLQRALDSPGLLDGVPCAHEHVRAGAVGGRPGTGRDRGRRGRGQDRLRGGHRQRGAGHAARHRRAEGRESSAPTARSSCSGGPEAPSEKPVWYSFVRDFTLPEGATRPSSW